MDNLPEWYLEQRRRDRDGIKGLLQAVVESDAKRFCKLLSIHFHSHILRLAFKRIARLSPPPSQEFQKVMVNVFVQDGDGIRSEIGDDLLLCDAFRVLLPPYRGGAPLRLYRGEIAGNRRKRTYGASWSLSREIADRFANARIVRAHEGGSVLLETDAPRTAIISAIGSDEAEVIIDRRWLNSVRVLARYPFVPFPLITPR
jgi:hypothetical protein